MPEGPECRRMALQLSEEVSSKKLVDIVVESGRYTKKPIAGLEEILEETPLTIRGAGVHGKFIFFLLDNEWSIWNTLGMTGGWSRQKGSKHARVRLVLEDGPIFFNDTRNFGTLKFVQGKDPIIDKIKSLGP
jgi:formamidopyrimidine-DNA glycosylase